MKNRILRDKVAIDQEAVKAFFGDRAAKYDPSNPFVSMLYQDANPALAKERDDYEKAYITPLLRLEGNDTVLDIGCGIGRWADVLAERVRWYHGTDLFEPLIAIAKRRFQDRRNVSFQTIAGSDISPDTLNRKPPYSQIVVAGVLHYANDDDCRRILDAARSCAAPKARIFIRGPVALKERLTLDRVWSEELGHEYSAIYRTQGEMREMFEDVFAPHGFSVDVDTPLFPPALNNREETRQHVFLLSRGYGS